MNLYYNTTAQCRVDENNTRIAAKPVIHYGACPTWELHFFSGDPGETPEVVDLSDIVAWRAAVDSDWNSSTEPMCRTLAADIDASQAAAGIISVPVNANTQRYLSVVTGKQSVGAWFELRGFDDQGNVSLVVLLNITCSNSIDPTGGAEPEPVDNDTATMTWVKAEIAQQLYYQYSADGSTWHNPPMVPDTDIYFRIRHGENGTPSAAQLIPYGPDGITPHIGDNGNWWIGTTDTGVKAEVSGSYITFNSVTSNQITLSGTETLPVAVLTNAGHLYPVEKGSLTVDTVNDTFTLDVTPYLAYDDVPSFSGTWRLYLAAYAPASESAYTKAAADALFATQDNTYTKAAADALLAGKMPVKPSSINLTGTTDGGSIDFHFGDASDSTSQIIESANGTISVYAPGGIVLNEKVDGAWHPSYLGYRVGMILMYTNGTGYTPPGFLTCNGAAVSRETYAALFGRIGTGFGSGDGSTTFNIPDLTHTNSQIRYIIKY